MAEPPQPGRRSSAGRPDNSAPCPRSSRSRFPRPRSPRFSRRPRGAFWIRRETNPGRTARCINSWEEETIIISAILPRAVKDQLDPDWPNLGDLDELEQLQSEALAVKNRIVEMNLRNASARSRTARRPRSVNLPGARHSNRWRFKDYDKLLQLDLDLDIHPSSENS
jgi:hypothetical protein